jgi:hypothetical protein
VVEIGTGMAERIDELAVGIADRKMTESGYRSDNASLVKRIQTGLYGECALGQMLGVDIIDWSVGDSSEFNVGDLSKIGKDVGVKTVEYWKFPIIHAEPIRPEVIILRHGLRFLVCGLYTPEVMKTYSSRDFIIDPKVRGSKTAFYGIPFYKSISTIDDI